MTPHAKLAKILDVDESLLLSLDKEIAGRNKKNNVLEKVVTQNEEVIETTLNLLNSKNRAADHVRGILRQTVFAHEKQFLDFLEIIEGNNEFEKAANLARKISTARRGFFLKKEFIREVLQKSEPKNLIKYLHCESIDEVCEKVDVVEAFSALRFVESNEWMHQMFESIYSSFTADDFEERDIEIKVLGPEWQEIAKKFVAKKHHNVSHLKEFGVIFLNPISMNIPGKFLRDFALLLHYFHEIEFYSKLFKQYAGKEDFTKHFKALLRGDVQEVKNTNPGEWLIVQRYLWKEDPKDPRLFLPRINPESLHWSRGERDLTTFGATGDAKLDLEMWHNMDWVGGIFENTHGDVVVSFDLEDTAMSLVSFMEGKEESFYYHQREAMWTKIFIECVGGEEEAEKLLIQNFDKGIISF